MFLESRADFLDLSHKAGNKLYRESGDPRMLSSGSTPEGKETAMRRLRFNGTGSGVNGCP